MRGFLCDNFIRESLMVLKALYRGENCANMKLLFLPYIVNVFAVSVAMQSIHQCLLRNRRQSKPSSASKEGATLPCFVSLQNVSLEFYT